MNEYVQDETRILDQTFGVQLSLEFPTDEFLKCLQLSSRLSSFAAFHVSDTECMWRVGSPDFVSLVTCTWPSNSVSSTLVRFKAAQETTLQSSPGVNIQIQRSNQTQSEQNFVSFPVCIGILCKRIQAIASSNSNSKTVTLRYQRDGQTDSKERETRVQRETLTVCGQFSKHATIEYSIPIPQWDQIVYVKIDALANIPCTIDKSFDCKLLHTVVASCFNIDAKQLTLEYDDLSNTVVISAAVEDKKLRETLRFSQSNIENTCSTAKKQRHTITRDACIGVYNVKYLYWFAEVFQTNRVQIRFANHVPLRVDTTRCSLLLAHKTIE